MIHFEFAMCQLFEIESGFVKLVIRLTLFDTKKQLNHIFFVIMLVVVDFDWVMMALRQIPVTISDRFAALDEEKSVGRKLIVEEVTCLDFVVSRIFDDLFQGIYWPKKAMPNHRSIKLDEKAYVFNFVGFE